MSKVIFYGYGGRETKRWNCPACSFSAYGMDLSVDESKKTHQMTCRPKFIGFNDVVFKESKYKVGQVVAILTYKNYDFPIERIDEGTFDKIVRVYDQDSVTWLQFSTYRVLPEDWVRPLNESEVGA